MLQRVRDSFFQVGWMLPMFVPASVTMGRALANVLFFSYFLWAILALRPSDFTIRPKLLLLYAVVVLVFLLSVSMAIHPSEALHTWFRWGTYTLALPVTLVVLSRNRFDEKRTARMFGLAALLAMAAFLIFLLVDAWRGEFIAGSINGMSMAYLMPFLVYWIQDMKTATTSRWLMSLVIIVAVVGLLFADSSTELLVIGTGLMVMMALMSSFGMRIFWVALLLLPSVLLIELLPKWAELQGSDLMHMLDIWTSYRASIWVGAFQYPPENAWLGVGMGHAQYYEPFLTIPVKGFHNFILDVWHETGVLGLTVLLSLLGYLIGTVLLKLREASAESRRRAAPWAASVAAILVAANLDHSYGSVSFALIMLFELAVLLVMLEPKRDQGVATTI